MNGALRPQRVVQVDSEHVRYTAEYIEADYRYETTSVSEEGNVIKVRPVSVQCQFRTDRRLPRLGVMLVGWGGNNGSTVTAAVLANRLGLQWRTRTGLQSANYYGSLTQSSTVEVGPGYHVPFSSLLPMVHPDDVVFGGWDISSAPLSVAMERAQVLEVALQEQLLPHMSALKPLPGVYDPDFIAANQAQRADNVITGTKQQQLDQLRADIRQFCTSSRVDKVIALWTANTECFCDVGPGLNSTEAELLASVAAGDSRVSPSTLYAMAALLEGCAFINGSPQNTLVPGVVQMAERCGQFVAGDDFKSGQTKVKSVLVDYLVSAGIKPRSIVSYNHLGNNDGRNLSAAAQFRSKEVSKSNVVDDMVASNEILYARGEAPDHTVVIKYVPYVGDSKRAMDEYTSEIMCGGHNTLVMHNTCEDSLLAAPLILDLVLLTELCQRVQFRCLEEPDFHGFHSVLSLLGYLCKAPLVPRGAPVINALSQQRAALASLLRAGVGLPPPNPLTLEHRLPEGRRATWRHLGMATEVAPPAEMAPQQERVAKLAGETVVQNGTGNTIGCNGRG